MPVPEPAAPAAVPCPPPVLDVPPPPLEVEVVGLGEHAALEPRINKAKMLDARVMLKARVMDEHPEYPLPMLVRDNSVSLLLCFALGFAAGCGGTPNAATGASGSAQSTSGTGAGG